jgi:hypothetical protein
VRFNWRDVLQEAENYAVKEEARVETLFGLESKSQTVTQENLTMSNTLSANVTITSAILKQPIVLPIPLGAGAFPFTGDVKVEVDSPVGTLQGDALITLSLDGVTFIDAQKIASFSLPPEFETALGGVLVSIVTAVAAKIVFEIDSASA